MKKVELNCKDMVQHSCHTVCTYHIYFVVHLQNGKECTSECILMT